MCIRFLVEEKALVNNKGEKVYPSCFVDLYAYYSYLVGRGQEMAAKKEIKKVFQGEKVISKMIDSFHKAVK